MAPLVTGAGSTAARGGVCGWWCQGVPRRRRWRRRWRLTDPRAATAGGLLLLLGPAGGGGVEHALLHVPGQRGPCSRERARHARGVVEELMLPFMQHHGLNFTAECPLNPALDMYREQERHKVRVHARHWKSLYSDKVFRSEHYVDVHMDNRHADKIPEGATVCLADYCDLLRCDDYFQANRHNFRESAHVVREGRCKAREMRALQALCTALVGKCVPDEARTSADEKLQLFFQHRICENLNCRDAGKIVAQLRAHAPSAMHPVRYILLFFSLVGIGLYYAVAFEAWKEGGGPARADLRRIGRGKGPRAAGGGALLLAALRRKEKHY